jgi:hypothetical protein
VVAAVHTTHVSAGRSSFAGGRSVRSAGRSSTAGAHKGASAAARAVRSAKPLGHGQAHLIVKVGADGVSLSVVPPGQPHTRRGPDLQELHHQKQLKQRDRFVDFDKSAGQFMIWRSTWPLITVTARPADPLHRAQKHSAAANGRRRRRGGMSRGPAPQGAPPGTDAPQGAGMTWHDMIVYWSIPYGKLPDAW